MSNPFIIQNGQKVFLSADELERLQKLEFIRRVHYHPARRNNDFAPYVLTVPYEEVEKLLELR